MPVFERAFDVGLRNHDGTHKNDIQALTAWLTDEQNKGTMKSLVPLDATSLVTPALTNLPKPLPDPGAKPFSPPQSLKTHFTVSITTAELCFGYHLDSDVEGQVPQTPPLDINIFDILVALAYFDTN